MGTERNDQLEIVNEQDEIIGMEKRGRIHRDGLLHREIHVWIYNSRGELLFQRRSPIKEVAPNLLDVSAGGHVDPGETYEQAALRELKEETGLSVTLADLKFLATIRRRWHDPQTDKINNTFRKVFAYPLKATETLKTEKNKSTGWEWWPTTKLLKLSKAEKKLFTPITQTAEYLAQYQAIASFMKGPEMKKIINKIK